MWEKTYVAPMRFNSCENDMFSSARVLGAATGSRALVRLLLKSEIILT
jgi:hypothetical protein